jgi:hypothetical protein
VWPIRCNVLVIARSAATKQSTVSPRWHYGLLRGVYHRARIRATCWLAMTWKFRDTIFKRAEGSRVRLLAARCAQGSQGAGSPRRGSDRGRSIAATAARRCDPLARSRSIRSRSERVTSALIVAPLYRAPTSIGIVTRTLLLSAAFFMLRTHTDRSGFEWCAIAGRFVAAPNGFRSQIGAELS